MEILKAEDRVYFKSEQLKDTAHGFTSKLGGFSHGKIKGLNLGFRVKDSIESVRKNYALVSQDLKMPFENIVAAKQIHSANIRVVTEAEKGCGVARLDETFECDGLVTDCKGIPLCVFYADCVPILLSDKAAGVIAAVHSGWRGTALGIVSKAVEVMQNKFGAMPQNIKAAIGPSIGKCCFETGGEVAELFDADLSRSVGDGKFKVDLWEANKRQLINCGVAAQNIEVLGLCTICRSDMLYSYRIHGESTGRMGAFIMLDER